MMSEGRSCSRSARACQCVFLTFITVASHVVPWLAVQYAMHNSSMIICIRLV